MPALHSLASARAVQIESARPDLHICRPALLRLAVSAQAAAVLQLQDLPVLQGQPAGCLSPPRPGSLHAVLCCAEFAPGSEAVPHDVRLEL